MKELFFKYLVVMVLITLTTGNSCFSAVVSITSGSGSYGNRMYGNGVNIHSGINPSGSISQRAHYQGHYRPMNMPSYGVVNAGYPVTTTRIYSTGGRPVTQTTHTVRYNTIPQVQNMPMHVRRYELPQQHTYTSTTTYYPVQTIYVNNGNGTSGTVTMEQSYTTVTGTDNLNRFLSW